MFTRGDLRMNNKYLVQISSDVMQKLDDLIYKTGLEMNTLLSNLIEENSTLKQRELNIFEVADTLADGIYLSDNNGIVIAVNNSYSHITGIRADEIVGRHMQTVLDKKYASGEYVVLRIEHLNESGRKSPKEFEEPYVTEKPIAIISMILEHKKELSFMATLCVNGIRKKVLFAGKPYYDVEGRISHVLTVIREITELDKLKTKLEAAERKSKEYLNELKYLRSTQMKSDLIGRDSSIEKIRQLIKHVAKTDATVLITGETGVGKEVVARELYRESSRNNRSYIKVNCAAIPETLLESELFGYEKGAFTGANRKEKLGYFEIANGGTILLDEIGEMPIKLQSKLLRVLQEKEITRIGGIKPISLNVRVIASTNQNIEEQIKNGTFREDLYYRLNVIPIKIPALRERRSDIALLAYKFLEGFAEKYNKNKEFEISAIEALECYEWPGNVRELENTIERLVIIGDETLITERDVINILGKDKFRYDVIHNEDITLKDAVDQLERSIIEKALRKYKSSRKAAKVLGVTQPTVLRKAKALGIEDW
jgi:PAS domain S-box-containing protein